MSFRLFKLLLNHFSQSDIRTSIKMRTYDASNEQSSYKFNEAKLDVTTKKAANSIITISYAKGSFIVTSLTKRPINTWLDKKIYLPQNSKTSIEDFNLTLHNQMNCAFYFHRCKLESKQLSETWKPEVALDKKVYKNVFFRKKEDF